LMMFCFECSCLVSTMSPPALTMTRMRVHGGQRCGNDPSHSPNRKVLCWQCSTTLPIDPTKSQFLTTSHWSYQVAKPFRRRNIHNHFLTLCFLNWPGRYFCVGQPILLSDLSLS
jgi:hypothetical protein